MLYSDLNLQIQNKYNFTNLYIVCKKCNRINEPIDRYTPMSNNNLTQSDNVNTNVKRTIDKLNNFPGQPRDVCRCSNGTLGKVVKIKQSDNARFTQIITERVIKRSTQIQA